jgi:tetratricopeptide (TPR) repeat protein
MSETQLIGEEAAALFRRGEQAQDEERYALASRHYRQALALVEGTDFEPARFNLGVVELRRGHAVRAAEIFSDLWAEQWDSPRDSGSRLLVRFNYALALVCAGEDKRAWEVAREVVLEVLDRWEIKDDGEAALRKRLEGPALALLATIGGRRGIGARSLAGVRRSATTRRLNDRLRHEPKLDIATAVLAAQCAREHQDDEPRTLYLLACYDARAADPNRALDELEEALAEDPGSIEWARRDPLLQSLRNAEPEGFRMVIRWARVSRAMRAIGLSGAAPLTPQA